MITNKDLKSYEFKTIEEYFDYVLESKINGQHKQAKEFFKKLSEKQRNDFFDYVDTLHYYDIENENDREDIADLQQYFKQ